MSTRQGGASQPPFDGLNLRPAGLSTEQQDDDLAAIAANQARYRLALGATPLFLRQVHGAAVVNWDHELAALDAASMAALQGTAGAETENRTCFPTADAAVTTRIGLACTVLVADCLPVLFTDHQGRAVAAAHAGWRGLSGGVLEATVDALCQAVDCRPGDVLAWLGPCIGPRAFEVGPDVVHAFPEAAPGRLVRADRPDGSPRWRADLAGLAQDRLSRLGLRSITPSGLCTVSDASRFFSFRRDGLTGRLAASIWRRA